MCRPAGKKGSFQGNDSRSSDLGTPWPEWTTFPTTASARPLRWGRFLWRSVGGLFWLLPSQPEARMRNRASFPASLAASRVASVPLTRSLSPARDLPFPSVVAASDYHFKQCEGVPLFHSANMRRPKSVFQPGAIRLTSTVTLRACPATAPSGTALP